MLPNHHLAKPVLIGEIQDDGQFDIVSQTTEVPGDALALAKYQHDTVIPAMLKLRELGDKLETLVDSSCWTLPTYAEMLFLR